MTYRSKQTRSFAQEREFWTDKVRRAERERDQARASLNRIADAFHVVHEDDKIVAAAKAAADAVGALKRVVEGLETISSASRDPESRDLAAALLRTIAITTRS